MDAPEVIYENRNVELLAFPLNHRIQTYGYMVREKKPQFNVRKELIAEYGLTLSEIGALKQGNDVVRLSEDGTQQVISNAEAAYLPYEPRSYAYCSDTAPFPELASWIRGVTLLYHEATFPQDMSEMAARTFHSTSLQAASVARDAKAGHLIVGHYSSRYPSVDFFLEEMKAVFPDCTLAHDGDVFELPLVRNGR